MSRAGSAATAQYLDAMASIQKDHPVTPIIDRIGLKPFASVQIRMIARRGIGLKADEASQHFPGLLMRSKKRRIGAVYHIAERRPAAGRIDFFESLFQGLPI